MNKIFNLAIFLTSVCISSVSVGATCDGTANPVDISSNCTDLLVNQSKSAVNINANVSMTPVTGSYSFLASPSSGSITIDSIVISSGNAVSIAENSRSAFRIGGSTSVTDITNNGTISNSLNGSAVDTGSRFSYVGTLTNNGVISSGGKGISIAGPVTNIVNSGSITGNSSGAIYLTTSTADLRNLSNSGSIYSAGSNAILVTGGGIGTITNTAALGTSTTGIFGGGSADIYNQGQIEVLNNAQKNLSITGNLPTNYNIIVKSPTSYGGLAGASLNSGTQTTFGISPLSAAFTPGVTTYTNVLSGMTSSNLTSLAGTYGGAFVTTQWQLVAAGNQFNLTTNTPAAAAAPVINGSAAGQNLAGSIAATYNAILAYSVANPAAPANPHDFMVNLNASGAALFGANQALFSQIVPTLTSAQAQQLEQAHAEGYSSNMTIGLEQMAHITNTVMDRIHAPMSSSPSTKVYQDDQGRYIWADAAAVKGTVNNNNNLAGFGYNLYDIIFGGDIKRSKEGGFGVFAGTGTTSMTESQQVTQNFNTTNFYAGLYGARNFDEQIKLSGALGYMYGSTSANRNIPDIGVIAASNATSSYKTNGVYGAAKLAKAYQAESFTVSPFIGASYSQLWMGGTSEQGGNTPFNYGISGATAYTAVTFAGADFIYPLLKGTNDPLSLIGFYKFGYDWFANSNSAHTITASGPTGSFSQVGANMGPISNMVGLGIQGGITKEVSARIGAVASYNTYGQEYGGGAEVRFKF